MNTSDELELCLQEASEIKARWKEMYGSLRIRTGPNPDAEGQGVLDFGTQVPT